MGAMMPENQKRARCRTTRDQGAGKRRRCIDDFMMQKHKAETNDACRTGKGKAGGKKNKAAEKNHQEKKNSLQCVVCIYHKDRVLLVHMV
jgi:hypothetical protein